MCLYGSVTGKAESVAEQIVELGQSKGVEVGRDRTRVFVSGGGLGSRWSVVAASHGGNRKYFSKLQYSKFNWWNYIERGYISITQLDRWKCNLYCIRKRRLFA